MVPKQQNDVFTKRQIKFGFRTDDEMVRDEMTNNNPVPE